MNPESLASIRELDSRVGDGLHVRLCWDERDGSVWVSVLDMRSQDALCIEVSPDQRPTDVFQHPFAYAPREHAEAVNAYAL
jgi:hypothetical protein